MLAHCTPAPSYTIFSRSSTFPKSRNFVAQERVREVANHLTRSYTFSSLNSTGEEGARDTALSKDSQKEHTIMTSTKAARQDECPTCHQPTKPAPTPQPEKPKPSGAVSLDIEVEDVDHQLPPMPFLKPHKDFLHCMPPDAPTYRKFSIFTAGSIEMGAAVQWQKQMATSLSDLPITVLNPRRGAWDPNATPDAKNREFAHQVQWELEALEHADVICFFFDTNTKSPVTMLELGLWASSKKIVVCCGKKFWRSGNVEITCKRYNIPFVHTFEELVPAVKEMLGQKGMRLDGKGDLVGENVRSKGHSDSPMDNNLHPSS